MTASGLAKVKVLRGAIGVNKPADLPSEGVTATIDIDKFDADAWRKLFAEINPPAGPTVPTAAAAAPVKASAASELATQFVPNRVAVHLTTLDLLNRRWGKRRGRRQSRHRRRYRQMAGEYRLRPGFGDTSRGRPARPAAVRARSRPASRRS